MARLFILSAVRLDDLPAAHRPGPGDVVALFRAAQDQDGQFTRTAAATGVTVVDANRLVGPAEAKALTAQIHAGLHEWYRHKGEDASACGWLSFGKAMGQHIFIAHNFATLATSTAIFVRLLNGSAPPEAIVTDIRDGDFVYSSTPDHPDSLLWRTVLEGIARSRGIPVVSITAAARLPSMLVADHYRSFWGPLRVIAGGLRPNALRKRLAACRTDPRESIYFFSTGDRTALIRRLAESGRIRAVSSGAIEPPAEELRFDQLFPWPTRSVLGAALRTVRHVLRLTRRNWTHPSLVVEGVDLAPHLLHVLRRRLYRDLPALAVLAAQIERLARILRPQAFVVANDGHPTALILGQLRARQGFALYLVNHGYDFMPILNSSTPACDRGMIYVAEGHNLAALYGYSLPEEEKPRRPVVTSTALAGLEFLRGRRPDTRRVLVTNFSALTPYTGRQENYDEYLLGVARAAAVLRSRHGIDMVYRPHPSEKRVMSETLFQRFEPGALTFDDSPSFLDALARCGAYVCNVSTCYYQALYAGWPTVFFDPDCRPDDYIGLIADHDTGRPLATTPDELVTLVVQAFEKDNAVATFPLRLMRDFAERYFGPGHDRPVDALADFFISEAPGWRHP